MVMGSIFDTPTDEEDQNPPQPQQPPPQDPLAQQPTQDQIDSLNHAQGVVQQGLQTVTNMFGPQAQQTADQNSLTNAQGLVNNAFQGIQTVGNAVDEKTARAQAIANQAGGGALDWYNQNVHNPIQQQVDQNTGPGLLGQLKGIGSGLNYTLGGLGRGLNDVLPSGTPDIVRDVGTNAANLLPWTAAALASGGGSVIPALTALGGSALGGVLAPKGANLLEQQGGVPGAIGQGLNTQVVPPWVPVFGGATPANVLGMAGGGAVGEGLPGLFDRGPRPDPLAAQPEPAQNFTNAQPSTANTGGFQQFGPQPQVSAVYHETSPFNAKDMLQGQSVPALSNPLNGLNVADHPNLALGQSGKGVMVTLDPAKLDLQAQNKAGAFPGGEYYVRGADRGAIQSVEFSPQALASDRVMQAVVSRAEQGIDTTHMLDGFDITRNPDGGVTLTRKGETTTTAPTSTTRTGLSPEEQLAFGAAGQTGESTGMQRIDEQSRQGRQAPTVDFGQLQRLDIGDYQAVGPDLQISKARSPGGGMEFQVRGPEGPQRFDSTAGAKQYIDSYYENKANGNTTTGPTSTTTTSGGGNYWDTTGIGPKIEAEQQRGPYIQWINENIAPEEQRVYKAALADVLAGKQAQAPTPEGTLGPDPATNPYRIAHDSIRQNLAPDMPYLPAPPPGSGATETPFRAYPGAPREAAPVPFADVPMPNIDLSPRQMGHIGVMGANQEQAIQNLMQNDGLTREQAHQALAGLGEQGVSGPASRMQSDLHEQAQAGNWYGNSGFWDNTTQFPDYKTGQSPFRSPEDGLIAEGHDGNIHNVTGFLGVRDGQQWFQTEDGQVPLSLLKNLSAADRAELGQMRTAAGGMPPNTPNATPPSGPNSPGAQGFQQSPAGQQFAGQGAAGMNVTQPGVSSSNAAPSTTYGGGAGGITGQAPPAGRPPSGGGQGGTGKPMPPPPRGVDPNAFQQTVAIIRAPLRILLAAPGHFLRVGAGQSATHWGEFSDALGDWGRTLASDAGKKAVQAELHDLPFVGGTLPANVPGDVRAETFRAQAGGNPPLNRAWIDKAMESVPILGPALRRMGEANGQFMASMRDSVYNTAAEKIARTVPDADVKFYKDTYDGISHSSGFSTGIPGFRGQGAGQALGTAPNSVIAKFQTGIDPFIKSGGPVPFVNAGARAENIRSLMGTAGIIGTINALGVAFGGKVSLPFSVAGIPASNITTPFGVESDLFKVITTNPAGTAKTAYSGASGYDTMLRLFANAGMAAFNGDWTGKNSVESHTLAWLRGELGPVPGTALDLLLGENWRGDPYGPKGGAQGMVNFNKDLHQGFANHWAPIAAQNMKAAYDAYGPEGLIRAAPSLGAFEAQTSPINTGSQAFKYATTPDTLTKAFTGQSAPLTTILQGKDWNDLMSTEKSALTKSLSPEQLQQIHEESFRQNPESTKRSDTIQYLSDKKTAIENELLDRYNAGQLDKVHVVDYMKAAQKDYYATKDKLDTNPAYLAEQQKFDKTNQSGAQTALDTFYQIPDKAGREAYLQHVSQADPELGTRLRIATQPQNQSKLELMYANGELR